MGSRMDDDWLVSWLLLRSINIVAVYGYGVTNWSFKIIRKRISKLLLRCRWDLSALFSNISWSSFGSDRKLASEEKNCHAWHRSRWVAGFAFTRYEANKHCIVTIHECLNCRKLKHVYRVLIHLFYRLYFVLFLSSFEFHRVYKIPHDFFIAFPIVNSFNIRFQIWFMLQQQ